MMTLNATDCRSVFIHYFDWTLATRPALAAAKLLDAQRGEEESLLVTKAERVWLEMDGEQLDLDAEAVRREAIRLLQEEQPDDSDE